MNNQEQSDSKLNKTVDAVVKTKRTINNIKKYWHLFILAIAVFVVMLFMFLIMSLEAMGKLDDESTDNDNNGNANVNSYSDLVANVNGSNNEEIWWPIGSAEVTSTIELDGATLEFRSGDPVNTEISAWFDEPDYPNHGAIDIYEGGDIYIIAIADGVVSSIENRDNGYNTWSGSTSSCTMEGCVAITITYNNGYESRYLHLENNSIPEYLQVGDKVYQGQVVGKMGNTGCSTGQHLHFALYLNGELVDPINYVSEDNPRPMASGTSNKSEDIIQNSTSISGSTTTPGVGEYVEGTSNQQTVCLTLKSYYSNNVVAGLMVNIEKESSFDPTNVTLDTNNEYSGGLFQWNAGRLTGLKSRHGDNWTSIANQIEYFQYEVSTTESATASILADTTSSASQIAYDFCETFERAANCSPRADESLANKYLTYVNNGCK